MSDQIILENSKRFRNMRAAIILVILLSVPFVVVTFFVFLLSPEREHERAVLGSQAEFNAQIASVRAGNAKGIFLYCSAGTDCLLEQLKDVPQLEYLNLHLTDVSDAGLKALTTLPKLKRLIIYGGNPGVSDAGFAYLSNASSLECLKLINTHVTDKSLSALKKLPKLRKLVLYNDRVRNVTFSDAGFKDLKALDWLERLELTGGWASNTAVDELQKDMPNCVIDAKADPEEYD